MLARAAEFEEEDKLVKERIDAKQALEGYLHSLTSTMEGENASKIDEEDKEKMKEAVDDAKEWLQSSGDEATAEDMKDKQKEVESVCSPIISKMYGAGGNSGDDDEDLDENDEL